MFLHSFELDFEVYSDMYGCFIQDNWISRSLAWTNRYILYVVAVWSSLDKCDGVTFFSDGLFGFTLFLCSSLAFWP